jgi:hypothetical protein
VHNIFFKGPSRRGGNPVGKDGKKLRCSICNSEEHFRAVCPQRKAGSHGNHSTHSTSKSFPAASHSNKAFPVSDNQSQDPTPQVWPLFFAQEAAASSAAANPAETHSWEFADVAEFVIGNGHVEVVPFSGMPLSVSDTCTEPAAELDPAATTLKPRTPRYLAFVANFASSQARKFQTWMEKFIGFHSNVRLKDKESLLIDIGAVGNLCGSEWAQRVGAEGKAAGQGATWSKLDRSIELEGVGQNSSHSADTCVLPIKLENGDQGEFRTLVVEGPLPALLGLEALTRHRALICTQTRRLILLGSGGYKLSLSPGSKVLSLYQAPTGHLMLPCCEWSSKAKSDGKHLAL